MEELLNEELEKLRLQQIDKRKAVSPDKLRQARANWNYRYYRAWRNPE